MGAACTSEADVLFPEPTVPSSATRLALGDKGEYYIGSVDSSGHASGEGRRFSAKNREIGGGQWSGGQQNGSGWQLDAQLNRYDGALVDGVPHGHGSKEYRSGNKLVRGKFSGEWIRGSREGQGSMTYSKGPYASFVGLFVDGEPSVGLLQHRDGQSFEGNFDSRLHWAGKGIEWTKDGLVRRCGVFRGDPTAWSPNYTPRQVTRADLGWPARSDIDERWQLMLARHKDPAAPIRLANIIWPHSGASHPQGSREVPIYIGEINAAEHRHGRGRLYKNTSLLRGDAWLDDKQNGQGEIHYDDGGAYHGVVFQNEPHGAGVLTRADREPYTYSSGSTTKATFSFGKACGEVRIDYLSSHSVLRSFEGTMGDGVQIRGRLTFLDGRLWEGGFKQERRDIGVMRYPDGQVAEGRWVSDEFENDTSTRECVRWDGPDPTTAKLLYSGREQDNRKASSQKPAAVLRSWLTSWPQTPLREREAAAEAGGGGQGRAKALLADLLVSATIFYIGQLDSENEPHGRGVLYNSETGAPVAGRSWKHGALHAQHSSPLDAKQKSFRVYANGNTYTGDFVDGLRAGSGELTFAPAAAHGKASYKGRFLADRMLMSSSEAAAAAQKLEQGQLLMANGDVWSGQLSAPALPAESDAASRIVRRVLADVGVSEADDATQPHGIGTLTLAGGGGRSEGTFVDGRLRVGIRYDGQGAMQTIGQFDGMGAPVPCQGVLRKQLPWAPVTEGQLATFLAANPPTADVSLAAFLNVDGSFFIGRCSDAGFPLSGLLFSKQSQVYGRVVGGQVEPVAMQDPQAKLGPPAPA